MAKLLSENQLRRLDRAHDEALELAEEFENIIPRDTEIPVALSALCMVIKFALDQMAPEQQAIMRKAVFEELRLSQELN